MNRPWRLLFTGKKSGAYNMAADAAVLRSVEAGHAPPTLRLYGWTPYCVSLGYFQEPEKELDAEALRLRGWDFVLRPTGGRAVLHAEEITYSLAMRQDAVAWGATLRLAHARISEAWSQAFAAFELRVADGKLETGSGSARRDGTGLPCFATLSRSELSHAGRKVVGSAQRRTRAGLLQHGSIPLSREHERLVEVLPLSAEDRDEYHKALRAHAISLGEIGRLPAAPEVWARDLAAAFCAALAVTAEVGNLASEETLRMEELENEHHTRQREFFASTDEKIPAFRKF